MSRPLSRMLPALRRIEAGDGVGQGGLAASVRADEAEDLAALDPHVDAVQRHDAAKAPLDGLALQYRTGALTSKKTNCLLHALVVLA